MKTHDAAPEATHLSPAERLTGLKLESGWTIGERHKHADGDTGGHFSVCYDCKDGTGRRAFLKALDFSGALQAPDPARALQSLTEAYNFERDLLQLCEPLSRVVSALEFGSVALDEPAKAGVVQYIIFECATTTVRRVIIQNSRPPASWCLRVLHEVTVGLRQLHGKRIAHQDLKPSNALLFDEVGAKIGDLGRSILQGRAVPHDRILWPGDWHYAPPEIAYGYQHPEFNVYRLASDLYQLGSLAVSVATGGVQMTVWLREETPEDLRPQKWGGQYTGSYIDVLPHIREAFAIALDRIRNSINESPVNAELLACVQELCDPDPLQRGHPRTRALNAKSGNPYELERYLARFDQMATKAAIFERQRSRP